MPVTLAHVTRRRGVRLRREAALLLVDQLARDRILARNVQLLDAGPTRLGTVADRTNAPLARVVLAWRLRCRRTNETTLGILDAVTGLGIATRHVEILDALAARVRARAERRRVPLARSNRAILEGWRRIGTTLLRRHDVARDRILTRVRDGLLTLAARLRAWRSRLRLPVTRAVVALHQHGWTTHAAALNIRQDHIRLAWFDTCDLQLAMAGTAREGTLAICDSIPNAILHLTLACRLRLDARTKLIVDHLLVDGRDTRDIDVLKTAPTRCLTLAFDLVPLARDFGITRLRAGWLLAHVQAELVRKGGALSGDALHVARECDVDATRRTRVEFGGDPTQLDARLGRTLVVHRNRLRSHARGVSQRFAEILVARVWIGADVVQWNLAAAWTWDRLKTVPLWEIV